MTNADWMSGFTDREDLTLADITFPASHDAGLHAGDGGFKAMNRLFQGKDDTICQYTNVAGQLAAGSRAFDLRVRDRKGVLRTYHSEALADKLGLGGWGQDLQSIFEQVDTFLSNHKGEICILRLSHTKEKDGAHDLVRYIDRSRLYTPISGTNIANVPLSDLRGKAIVIFDDKALEDTDPINGMHRFTKLKSSPAPDAGLAISGSYAGFSAGVLINKAQMMREITFHALTTANDHAEFDQIHYNGRRKHDHLFMVYWQLAFNVKSKTVTDQESKPDMRRLEDELGTHHNLDYLLNWFRGKEMYHVTLHTITSKKKGFSIVTPENRLLYRPNWINLDFIDEAVCSKVIAFNADLLKDIPK